MTIAITAVLCIVLGAFIQTMLSKVSQELKYVQVARIQAYVDYLRALSEAIQATTDEERKKAALASGDAKVRMAIYADKNVLEALADFDVSWPTVDTPEAHMAFLRLAEMMRFLCGPASLEDVSQVLLGFGIDGPPEKLSAPPKEKRRKP